MRNSAHPRNSSSSSSKYSKRGSSFYTPAEKNRPIAAPLDTSRAARKAWLVKVPKWLSAHWCSLPQTSTLASFSLPVAKSTEKKLCGWLTSLEAQSSSNLCLDLSPSNPPKGIPRNLKLNVLFSSFAVPPTPFYIRSSSSSADSSSTTISRAAVSGGENNTSTGTGTGTGMGTGTGVTTKSARKAPSASIGAPLCKTFVFAAESRKGVASELSAEIVAEFQASPFINKDYSELMKSRTAKAALPQRSLKFVPLSEVARLRGCGYSTDSKDSTFAPAYIKQRIPEKTRKERLPHQQLIQHLILLFQEYPYWSLKNLVEKTQQPQLYLKEVLLQVGHLNKRGPYAGLYSALPSNSTLIDTYPPLSSSTSPISDETHSFPGQVPTSVTEETYTHDFDEM